MFQWLSYQLNKEQKKIILLSSVGGLLEFYDFTIYGLFAGYFAQQFFPAHDELISLIASYSIFVVGYIVRPVGGIIFSHIGDVISRKRVLIMTMMLMGVASIGIGILPTYAQIGIYAPILMLVCRLIQGLAIGGELPSMIVYVSEAMPDKRGLAMGGIFSGTVAGLVPGMLLNLAITHCLTLEQITNYGWRLPFIGGGFLCFIAYRVRRELHESLAFKHVHTHQTLPFAELMQHHLGKVVIGMGLVSIMATPIILLLIFMPTYLTKIVGVDSSTASNAVLVASLVSMSSIYLMGKWVNQRNLFKLTYALLFLIPIAAAICYTLISNNKNLLLALSLFAIVQGFLATLPPIFLSYLFPLEVRLTGVALAYNLSFVIFGGLTPVLVTALIEKTGLIYLVPVGAILLSVLFAVWAVNKCKSSLTM